MRSFFLGLLLVIGCGRHAGPANDAGQPYDSIDVEPPQATLTVPLGGTGMQSYQVFGVEGGQMTDLTADCVLSIDPAFGAPTGATITVSPHGGKTTVTAVCGAQTGTSQLLVNLSGQITTGASTPANAAMLFGAATAGSDPTRAPTLQYPLDKAIAPLNIPAIEVQWTAAGDDLFHIAMSSTFASIDVYTSDLQSTLADADWSALAGTAAGESLQISVEGLLQAAPTTKFAGAGVALALSHDTIDTSAIYYWASSQGSIMTETFGNTGSPTVVKNNCTACHSLSRSGTRLGYSRCVANNCGTEYAGFMHFDPLSQTWNEVVDADNMAINGTYTTFSPPGNPFPDDGQSVAIVTMTGGHLSLYDPDTGTAIASNLDAVSTHGAGAPRSALMADWSADGNTIVFASTPHPGETVDLADSSIATMSYAFTGGQHVFGEPQLLVSQPIVRSTGTFENFFFPSFSPDGALVVFDAARSSWRNFSVAASAGQRLMLTDAAGTGVVDLTALNGGDTDLDTTWAHWAPGNTTDYYWIVFSSERDYGHEVTAGNTATACVENGVKQCKQIWIAAIDKTKLAAGLSIDPSAAPMWLPGQDTQADNISPYWTVPPGIQ